MKIKPRILNTTINLDDETVSLDLALSLVKDFRLLTSETRMIIKEVDASVAQWHMTKSHELDRREIERVVSAFEHIDV